MNQPSETLLGPRLLGSDQDPPAWEQNPVGSDHQQDSGGGNRNGPGRNGQGNARNPVGAGPADDWAQVRAGQDWGADSLLGHAAASENVAPQSFSWRNLTPQDVAQQDAGQQDATRPNVAGPDIARPDLAGADAVGTDRSEQDWLRDLGRPGPNDPEWPRPPAEADSDVADWAGPVLLGRDPVEPDPTPNGPVNDWLEQSWADRSWDQDRVDRARMSSSYTDGTMMDTAPIDFGAMGPPQPVSTEKDSSTGNVLRSSGVMAIGTAASRLLGFVRAAVLVAAVQPTSPHHPGLAGDAFQVANTIPNALYILLAGGVLNAVLVPQITRAAKRADGGQEYINRLLTSAIALLLVVTVVITFAAPLMIKIYATGSWSPAQHALAISFALWCLPQIFFYGLYTILGQVLNARGSFGPFTWSPVLNNVVAIFGMAIFIAIYHTGVQPGAWSSTKVTILAGTATLGVVAQAVVLIPALKRSGITYQVRWGLRGFGMRTAGRVAGWTFAAILIQQVGFVVITRVTTAAGKLATGAHGHFSTGAVVYSTAYLLFMLPHSLVAVSLVTALFTRMSVSAAENRLDAVRDDLSLGLRLTGLATVLSTVAFLAIGPDISGTLFAGSPRSNTLGFAYVAMAMMIGLVPFSAQYLFQRVFYAFEDARTPFLVQVPVVIIWAVGNLISLHLFASHPEYIVVGVGLSMAVSNIFGAALSFYLLTQRFGDLDGERVLKTHVRMFVAAGVGGVVAFILSHLVHHELGVGRLATMLAALLGGTALIGVYVVGLRRLRVTELDDTLMPLIRRRR